MMTMSVLRDYRPSRPAELIVRPRPLLRGGGVPPPMPHNRVRSPHRAAQLDPVCQVRYDAVTPRCDQPELPHRTSAGASYKDTSPQFRSFVGDDGGIAGGPPWNSGFMASRPNHRKRPGVTARILGIDPGF